MGRWLILLTLTLVGFGCSGSMSQTCPDGEPVYIRSNIEEAFPAYVREYEGGLSVTSKVLADTQVGVAFKTKAVRLREELNQVNSDLQERRKAVLLALQMSPCDKVVRDKGIDFLTDVKSQTKRIPDRIKEFHDEAAVKLHSEVSNLIRYPDAARDSIKPPTIFEDLLVNKLPRRLFDLLITYNDEAILNVPNIGSALRDHKVAYYGFRQRVTGLEETLTPRIGEMVMGRRSQTWKIYFSYLVIRFGGSSHTQIVKSGDNFLNHGATWDECGRVFDELSRDQAVSKYFSDSFAMHNLLAEGVKTIASAI